MFSKSLQRNLILVLLLASVLLPAVVCVLVGLGWLLRAMGDAVGGIVLDRVALALGIVWILDLLTLVLALAVERLTEPCDPPEG